MNIYLTITLSNLRALCHFALLTDVLQMALDFSLKPLLLGSKTYTWLFAKIRALFR